MPSAKRRLDHRPRSNTPYEGTVAEVNISGRIRGSLGRSEQIANPKRSRRAVRHRHHLWLAIQSCLPIDRLAVAEETTRRSIIG